MKVFLDSSILVEYIKGNNVEFFETLIEKEIELCINPIVYSEFIFHFLAIMSKKSQINLKKQKEINQILIKYEPENFLSIFTILEINEKTIDLSQKYLKENFLPNDSLILASCKQNKINYLVTLDSDFNSITEIKILNSIDKLKIIK